MNKPLQDLSKQEVLSNIKNLIFDLHNINPKLLEDKEVISTATKENNYAFSFASKTIKDDLLFILELLKKPTIGVGILEYVSDRIKSDKHDVLALIHAIGNSCPIQHVSSQLQDDEQVVSPAIFYNEHSFKFASDRLKDNKQITLYAVKMGGMMLEHASERLKNDPEIVLAAINQNYDSIKHANARYSHLAKHSSPAKVEECLAADIHLLHALDRKSAIAMSLEPCDTQPKKQNKI